MAGKYIPKHAQNRHAPAIYNGDKNALNIRQEEELLRAAREKAEADAALAESDEVWDEEEEEEVDEEFSVDPEPRLTGLVCLAVALTAGIIAVVLYWVRLLGGIA